MTTYHAVPEDAPIYMISIAARMVGVHQQTLRYYERLGIVLPSRSEGRTRLYSPRDVERIRRCKVLVDELGVSAVAAGMMLKMEERMNELQHEVQRLRAELSELRGG
jgi:MerR family transcriptional regulator/heat shock protein HspR